MINTRLEMMIIGSDGQSEIMREVSLPIMPQAAMVVGVEGRKHEIKQVVVEHGSGLTVAKMFDYRDERHTLDELRILFRAGHWSGGQQ